LRELSAGVLARSFCKPSLFGYLGLPVRQAKFFTLWVSFWAKRFGVGCGSWLAGFRDGFVFFMFNVILPELHKKVYDGRVGSLQQLASLQVHAQQSVHPTLGILRTSQAFFYASAFFQSDGVPPPAPARVTQTVGKNLR
jgi:hypothetical protein